MNDGIRRFRPTVHWLLMARHQRTLLAWSLRTAVFERGAMTKLNTCRTLRIATVMLCLGLLASSAQAQGLGGAGTVQGTVKDPTGGVMQAVEVKISNPLSGFTRTSTTDAMGRYSFSNLAPNPYHVSVEVQGFQPLSRDVDVRTGIPVA